MKRLSRTAKVVIMFTALGVLGGTTAVGASSHTTPAACRCFINLGTA